MQEILLLFVVCWSLSVVCRSFKRNGNACLFICLFPRSVSRFLQEAVVVTHVHRQRR
jgi:hypothetical protein